MSTIADQRCQEKQGQRAAPGSLPPSPTMSDMSEMDPRVVNRLARVVSSALANRSPMRPADRDGDHVMMIYRHPIEGLSVSIG